MSATSPFLRRSLTLFWLPALLVVLVWGWSAGSTSLYFPPASTVVSTLLDGLVRGELVAGMTFSMKNYAAGLAVAIVAGVGLGLVLGERPTAQETVRPVLNFLRSVPHVAFVPIVILALGIGAGPKVFLIAFGCFWPILLNTIEGVRNINPAILEAAHSYRIPRRLRVPRVVLMGALPQMFAGLRIAISIGIVMVVVSEMYGSSEGLGYYILFSAQRFAVAETWAGTLLIGIVGYAVNVGFLAVEQVMLAWHFQRPRRRRLVRTQSSSGKRAHGEQ